MPLIRRLVKTESESTFSQETREHTLYVPARRLLPTDRIVKAEDIPDATLQDLAHRFPNEYGKALEDRGIDPLEPADEDHDLVDPDDEDDDDPKFTDRQLRFMQLNAEEAITAVREAIVAKDAALMAEYLEAEEAQERPRKTVLAVLTGREK